LAELGVVALVTGLAAALRFALSGLIGIRIPFFTFYPAIIVCAAYGGLRAGVACTVASSLLVQYFWLPPVHSFVIQDAGDGIALAIFAGSGGAIAVLHEKLHRQRAQVLAARAQAEAAAREAEAANRAKDEFLSVLSHELRTPLTAILGWSSMLAARDSDAVSRARAHQSIARNARAQAQIVDDILDVSRITAGKLKLDLSPTDLAPVVAAALDVVRPAAEAKGVDLSATLDPAAGVVWGDEGRLQQVAWNLLANAVKFTRRGGRIDVLLHRDGSAVRLVVMDSGEGIRPDFLPHVFERFRQSDASSTRAHGGLGLGLAIVKHLVELHGGTVAAESAGLGKGATFTVRLPIQAVVPARESARLPRATPAETFLGGMRVLVVDDDGETLELVSALLAQHGATVTIAPSAAEALRALEGDGVDVLVADIDMPGQDGYELMRRAAALFSARGLRLPALALTACAGARDVQEAIRAGFLEHLAKPVLPERLVEAVARLGCHRDAPVYDGGSAGSADSAGSVPKPPGAAPPPILPARLR
jgi:signal transduction histidine kinase/ActR/RegA family two-component response regulator